MASYNDLEITFTAGKTATTSKATIHYVQAGNPQHPTVLLLHGFPASSNQYRNLIPMLSANYHVLAPDYPGFGLTKVSDDFVWDFDNINTVMTAWLQAMKIKEAAVYIQDFGAPVGLRLAITKGLKLTAIIAQNGNAYDEGVGKEALAPLIAWWESGSDDWRKVIQDNMLTLEGAKEHITIGTPEKDLHLIDPTTWELAYLQNIVGPVKTERMLALLYDYRTNLKQYPQYQEYIRESKVPVLTVWGKGDPCFTYHGAEAFRTDSPDADIRLIDAGHYALETKCEEIGGIMNEFLGKVLKKA